MIYIEILNYMCIEHKHLKTFLKRYFKIKITY
jgi:hypothetical protein